MQDEKDVSNAELLDILPNSFSVESLLNYERHPAIEGRTIPRSFPNPLPDRINAHRGDLRLRTNPFQLRLNEDLPGKQADRLLGESIACDVHRTNA